MSCHYYRKSAGSKKGIQRKLIPEEYTLNSGHAMFFYNKFSYIKERHEQLEQEMLQRSYKIRGTYDLKIDWILPHDMNDYSVTYKDKLCNVQRILQRIYEMQFIKGKPEFYKLKGKSMSFLGWSVYYTEVLELDCKDVHDIIRGIEEMHAL